MEQLDVAVEVGPETAARYSIDSWDVAGHIDVWMERSQHGSVAATEASVLVVRQSASSISAVLLTDESSSRSTLASLAEDEIGAALSYIYLNRPKIGVEHRSRMHNGSAFLEVSGRPASRLYGRYWTDRDTRGEFNFDQCRIAIADDFDEALRLFQE